MPRLLAIYPQNIHRQYDTRLETSMTNYIGVKCPVCNKKFAQNDDVVVCPTCGAPHHRDCYKLTNECAFVEEHLGGKVWHNPHDEQISGVDKDSLIACSVCGRKVLPDAVFCQHCGSTMQPQEPKHAPKAAMHSNPGQQDSLGWGNGEMPHLGFMEIELPDAIGETKTEDLNKYVGQSQSYYLPRFFALDKIGRKISPNFAAMFFNFFYYLYRKMYLIGFFLLGVNIISMIPSVLYSWETLPILLRDLGMDQTFAGLGVNIPSVDQVDMVLAEHYFKLSNITQTASFVVNLVVSLFANHLYYTKCVKDIAKIREEALDKIGENDSHFKIYCDSVYARMGGVTRLVPVAVTLVVGIIYFVVTYMALYKLLLP